jgi:hypothetical protein
MGLSTVLTGVWGGSEGLWGGTEGLSAGNGLNGGGGSNGFNILLESGQGFLTLEDGITLFELEAGP